MSSKLFLPNDSHVASPVIWRRVGAGAESAGSPEADSGAQMAQLQRLCEQRVQEAHAAGLREGEATGRNRASAELQTVIERLARAIQEIAGLRASLRRQAEGDLVRLALAIARRVVRREMTVDPDALHGLVMGALEKLAGQEVSRVRVHPSHAAMVSACLQKAVTGAAVEVVSDPSREPGTVIFETSHGNLDASVDAQLQEIERGLMDRLRKQP